MATLAMRVLGQGERVPMLLDDTGLPLFYPTLFATSQLRNAGAAVNTIRNKLSDILVLLKWEARTGRDLAAEFAAGRFMSVADIVSLRDFAKLDMRHVSSHEKAVRVKATNTVTFPEAHLMPSEPAQSVGTQQHYNRMTTMADYLEFLGRVLIQHRNSPELALSLSEMAKRIRKHRPRGSKANLIASSAERSPDPSVVKRLSQVIDVESVENPFKNPAVKLRNSIIIELFRLTGMRTGELLSLRVDQFDLGYQPCVRVRRNHDDQHDCRVYQPASKTKERVIAIPDALAMQVQEYILEVRGRILNARRHPYLFVSHKKGKTLGSPLSRNGMYRIIERIRAASTELESIHPHALRHHMNYQLSVMINEHNAAVRSGKAVPGLTKITEAQEKDMRAYLNGHRSTKSGEVYNQRHTRERAEQAMRLLGERLSDGRKG